MNSLWHRTRLHTSAAAILLAAVTLVPLCLSCSTKHNTGLSRGYQRMTSRYNVYFNAKEAFDDGIDKTRTKTVNDYSHVLPVFEFSNPQAARVAQGDMETVLKKSHKLIQLHSITVKPEYSGSLTDEQKRFRSKTEFNPYVGEAYLLIGKANVVIHEEQEAIEQFDYISRIHEGERASYEARIWKAVAYTQLAQYNNAMAALKSYDMDGVAPTNLYPEFQAAYANIYIEQGLYAQAIPYMEKAAAEVKDKHCRRRYKYILAQLYRATGQRDKAAPLFLELSRQLGDYDMAFAAKLDLPTVASTPEELEKAEKMLNRMASDPKNTDQLDQVYYAIGHLDLGRGDKSGAVEAFNKSVETSVTNDNQKGLSFLSLADIYQAEPQYIEASTSLDSAAFYLDDSNERKDEARKRSQLLAPLATELRTVRDNDSLLRIARMSDKERNVLIDKMVKEHNDEVEARREAREADEINGMNQMDFYQIQQSQTSSGSSWYFYNNSLVSAGKATFRQKWGNRKNEDDWRRSDKSSNVLTAPDADADTDEQAVIDETREAMAQNEADGKWTRDMLLKNLPTSPEAQKENEQQTAKAMLKAASLLYDDIHDYVRCAELLEEYRRRFPAGADLYDALALLHFAQQKNGDTAGMADTDAQILRQFPESLMAKNISDPTFAQSLAQKREADNEAYRQTYKTYLTGGFGEVITRSTSALDNAETEADLRPNYLLLRAMAQAKSGNGEAFRGDLETIHASHAGTPQDSLAVILLAQLSEGKMPVRHEDYESPLAAQSAAADGLEAAQKAQYLYEPDSAHVVVCFVDNAQLKEAQFAVADYNFSNFLIGDYDVLMRKMPHDAQAIVVRPFANRKEAETYFYAIREQAFWRELTEAAIPRIYIMSVTNLQLLQATGPDEAFAEFMNANYGL